MENYIVRIYRRSSEEPYSITGVVESFDHSVEKKFNTFEELAAILVQPKDSARSHDRKKILESRKYRRFATKDCTLVFESSTDVGKLVDISMAGLSFTCPDRQEESVSPFAISIICGENKYSTGDIQCRKLMCYEGPGEAEKGTGNTSERYGIEFDDLTPKQRLSLEQIIQEYTLDNV